MTTNPSQNTDPPGQTPPGSDPQGQTPPPTLGQTPPAPPQQQQKTPLDTLPSDVQDYIKLLRKEAKETREALEAEARRKTEAEQQRLKEQGEFKQLAEKHENRVKELEPIATRYTSLAQLVSGQIEDQVKDWPAEIKVFDPGTDAPIEERLEWVKKSRPLVEKMIQQNQAGQPGNAPNPRPAAGQAGTAQQNIDALRQRYQTSRGNPF